MDILNQLETAPARHPPDPGHEAPPGGAARRRQRAATADSREHVELPLDGPDASPRRALHDDELWRLARRAHGAALHVGLELRSSLVRQVFRRDFVYVSRLLHALEASRRVRGMDRAFLDDALAAIQRRADDARALLGRIEADVQAWIGARDQPDAPITFARPARFLATVVSPEAHRYLALLVQADVALGHLERAWLLGAVDPATRTALIGDCRRALQGFKTLACDRRAAIGDHVREVNARRKAAVREGGG